MSTLQQTESGNKDENCPNMVTMTLWRPPQVRSDDRPDPGTLRPEGALSALV